MRVLDISVLGWIHTLACLVALPTGLAVLAMVKGTMRHRRLGTWYVGAMVIANLTAFGLFAPISGVGPGFNRFHVMALITLIALLVAYVGARRQRQALWAYLHPTGMIVSYYFLIGGLINEALSRIEALAPVRGPGQAIAQSVNMLAFTVVLIVALLGVAQRRSRLRAAA